MPNLCSCGEPASVQGMCRACYQRRYRARIKRHGPHAARLDYAFLRKYGEPVKRYGPDGRIDVEFYRRKYNI